MPNWCSNSITISHDDPAMIKRLAEHKDDPLQEFIPCPHDPKTSDEWYSWRVSNWGTKWDITLEDVQIIDEGKTLTAIFDSAWAPPLEAYAALESQGFTIDAFYYEPGMCFAGRYMDGEDNSVQVDFSDPDWSANMDDDIVEYLTPDYENWKEWNEEVNQEREKANDAA